MSTSNPIVADPEFYNELGKKYEDAFGHDQGLHKAVQRFLDYLPSNATILDCGSGTGKPVSHLITSSGRTVHGIDRSPGMIELSRKQVPSGTFELHDMLSYEAPKAFDGVVASLSLFELPRADVATVSRNFSKWLISGGYLLIVTIAAEDVPQASPNTYDADGECAQKVLCRFMGNVVRITLFTKAGWRKLLEDQGLEIVHTEVNVFQPAADCDEEPHYFIIARKKG